MTTTSQETTTMTTSYVYRRTEPTLWTVGFYRPDGTWEPESDHGTADEAAARVHYLNGGATATPLGQLTDAQRHALAHSLLDDLDAGDPTSDFHIAAMAVIRLLDPDLAAEWLDPDDDPDDRGDRPVIRSDDREAWDAYRMPEGDR
jgi:hypothetical protein